MKWTVLQGCHKWGNRTWCASVLAGGRAIAHSTLSNKTWWELRDYPSPKFAGVGQQRAKAKRIWDMGPVGGRGLWSSALAI